MEYLYKNENPANVVADININLSLLKDKWNCEENSFSELHIGDYGVGLIEKINHNLRSDIIAPSMTGREFMGAIKYGFSADVRRFQDMFLPNVLNIESAEPTAIVSADGNRMDLYSHRWYSYTNDGIHFAQARYIDYKQTDTAYTGMMCEHYFLYGGYIYAVSACSDMKFLLWKSELEAEQIPLSTGTVYFGEPHELYTNPSLTNIGNSFLFVENSTWYFIYEGIENGGNYGYGYQIWIAQANSMKGTYTKMQSEPIIIEKNYDGVGNPELAMVNNTIYKCDGKYYMYYHFHNTNEGYAIKRAYSYDLLNWHDEGAILDVRRTPSFTRWSNGDQSFCEFKGHTYQFYTYNANQYLDPHEGYPMCIDMCVDFRPMSEILRLRP